jgi:hypothetical protein
LTLVYFAFLKYNKIDKLNIDLILNLSTLEDIKIVSSFIQRLLELRKGDIYIDFIFLLLSFCLFVNCNLKNYLELLLIIVCLGVSKLIILVSKISSRLGLMCRLRTYLPTEGLIMNYNGYILPLFDYCCTVCMRRNHKF